MNSKEYEELRSMREQYKYALSKPVGLSQLHKTWLTNRLTDVRERIKNAHREQNSLPSSDRE